MKGIEQFPTRVLSAGILSPTGFFVLEHFNAYSYDHIRGFQEARHYGQSVFSFFAPGS
jgi:hypothetical protein